MSTITLHEVTLSRAMEAFNSGEHESALNLFLEVLKLDPKNPDALYFSSIIDHQAGRTEVAEYRAEELIAAKPRDGKALNLLGTIRMSTGKLAEASDTFDKGIKHDKTNTTLLVNSAICNIGLGKPEKAIERCLEAITLQPEYPNAHNMLGSAYLATFDYAKAAESFQQAITLNPDFIDARFNLGKALLEQNEHDRALEHFNAVLEKAPLHTHALTGKGDAMAAQRKITEAGTCYEQAVQANPAFVPAHIGLGKLFQLAGKPNDALSHFKTAVELNPNSVEALVHTGDAFRKLGQNDAALAAFRDALSIDPGNAEAQFFIAALEGTTPPAKPDAGYIQGFFDRFAETFDESLTSVEYNAPVQLAELAKEHLDDDAIGTQDVLDLGCGTGLIGYAFKDITGKLKGSDLSPRMVDVARARNLYDELEVNDLLTTLVKHQSDTDIVVTADVFPYIGDLESSFLAIYSALRNNGLFLFTTESHKDADNYRLNTTGRYSHSRDYINSLAERRGFEVLSCNNAVYRKESGDDVPGLIVALRKPA